MKRFLPIIALGVAAVTASGQTSPTSVQMTAPADTVSVSGTGRMNLTPDRFTFTVGVHTTGTTVDAAVSENNRRTAAVIAALRKAGAVEGDIQTAQFNIYPQQDYREGQQPRILGYQVTNSINVRSRNVGDAGRLLGIAIGAGVNTSSGINFEVTDPARGRDQGLKAAFDDAHAKATLLARSAGRTLGRAIYISEGTQQHMPPPTPMPRTMAMEARVSDVPIEAGALEASYQVSVVFEMR
ncbi:MAG TPA: SIMPL domain-containing protein [Thermoanaerobaculia bacterium]